MTPQRARALSMGGLLGTVLVVALAALLVSFGGALRIAPPTGPAPTQRPVPPGVERIIGAGDIADCGNGWDEWTARLVESYAGTVLALGDNAYETGSVADYRDCYAPSWGAFRDRTRPVPGNHDYGTRGAAGYFDYFGPSVTTDGDPWYAYDLGSWRLYALDANCPAENACDAAAELAWLVRDLAANPRQCVLAYWHQPRFSSGRHGSHPSLDPIWRALAAAGADVVLNGHDHIYERFAALDADGQPAPTGMREFVVGTGGKDLYEIHAVKAGSEVRNASTFGVLVVDLRDGSYDWRFVPAEVPADEASNFTDAGTTRCH